MTYLRRLSGRFDRRGDDLEVVHHGRVSGVNQLVLDGLGVQHSAYCLHLSNMNFPGGASLAVRPVLHTSTSAGSDRVTAGYSHISMFWGATTDTAGATTNIAGRFSLVDPSPNRVASATSGQEITTETWIYGLGSASQITKFENYYHQAPNVTGVFYARCGTFGQVTGSQGAVENALVLSMRNISSNTATTFACDYTLLGYKR